MKKSMVLAVVTAVLAVAALSVPADAADEVTVNVQFTLTQIEIEALCHHYGHTENGVFVPATPLEAKKRLSEIWSRQIANIAERYVSEQALGAARGSGDLILGQ